ncbi:MAG TPA: hypothetical protein VH281_02145 [Gaiellaceae bacterium]
MLSFAPRIDSRLVAAAERLDDPRVSIAETNRRVGMVAGELGLVRPSYEQVRCIVHLARRRGRRPTSGDVLLEIAFRSRPPTALLDHLTGTLPPKR